MSWKEPYIALGVVAVWGGYGALYFLRSQQGQVQDDLRREAGPRRRCRRRSRPRAAGGGAAVAVKLQGDADDVVPLLLEQGSRHGRIDATGHGDNYAPRT